MGVFLNEQDGALLSETTVCDNQERCLPANLFSLDGGEHFESDKPWKNNKTLFGGSENGSEDEESKDSHTHKKARRLMKMPQVEQR